MKKKSLQRALKELKILLMFSDYIEIDYELRLGKFLIFRL